MNNNFKALHYDDTISMHSDIKTAMDEAVLRLEPWRDKGDRIVRQLNETKGSKLSRILVVNSVNEPTDAASYISPCGDWIDARKCLPKAEQTILVHALDLKKNRMTTRVLDSQFVARQIQEEAASYCVWWRPIPALPVECKGASQC